MDSGRLDGNNKRPHPVLVVRPEFVVGAIREAEIVDAARKLPIVERLWNVNGIRKAIILFGLITLWQTYAVVGDVDPLLFPSFLDAVRALWHSSISGEIFARVWFSVKLLVLGYVAALILAAALVLWATASRTGSHFLSTVAAMFNPLPAIALLPLALLWFGLGPMSLVFVLVHSILWAVALSTHTGFMTVSETLRMVGRNYGLRGPNFVLSILAPAAFPSILAGMKIGWAFAWRTLIAAELVFGATTGGYQG